MADARVKYVARSEGGHEAISHLGSDGWRLSVEEVIKSIEGGSNSFYVRVAGERAELAVAHGPHGKYLRSRVGRDWNDALLELPSFPRSWDAR